MCAIGIGQEALKSEISTITTELKSDICAGVKFDMSKIKVGPIIQVHAMENKMSNCTSVITEEFQTQIGDMCAAKTELEERLDKQQKNVNSMVEQQIRNLLEDIEATRRESEAQLAVVETRTRRTGGSGPGVNTSKVKLPKFDAVTPWAVFHRHFDAAAGKIIVQPMRNLLIF
jgi:hypothetical protein